MGASASEGNATPDQGRRVILLLKLFNGFSLLHGIKTKLLPMGNRASLPKPPASTSPTLPASLLSIHRTPHALSQLTAFAVLLSLILTHLLCMQVAPITPRIAAASPLQRSLCRVLIASLLLGPHLPAVMQV